MPIEDIYANCRFYVEIDGLTTAVFTEMSGLQVETAVMEYEEGGNNGFVHRLPGRTKVGTITLKRGVTKQNEFFKWFDQIMYGNMYGSNNVKGRHMSVVMYDTAGQEMTRWNFQNAYPVKWTGPQFAADGKIAAIESIELAHDGLVPS
jgi:phage tail-like protein